MHKILLVLFAFSLHGLMAHASDTTSIAVLFPFNQYQLTKEAKDLLDGVKPVDSNITLTNIKIYGHTDQVGSSAYNKKLSLQRAEQTKAYLISTGIDASIITIVEGYGKEQLLNNSMNDAARQQNRRVIVEIAYESKMIEQTVVITRPKQNKDTTTKKPTLIDKIKDTATKVGDNITLQNILFEGGRHEFLPQSYDALNELLAVMTEVPSLVIEIQGHICCEIGDVDGIDAAYGTRDLSVQRARAVYQFLFRNGVDVSRMTYKGFGHRYPLNDERTEAEKTKNRRVEIKIISK
jgi:outer membrane protein OmpA-like peptidoglycan-associated protein